MVAKSVTIDFEFDWGSRIKSDYAIRHTTEKILKIFDKKEAKGTFFISTETLPEAEKYVRMIAEHSHEIASHGHNHTLDYDIKSRDELYEQIKKSKDMLEDIIQKKVVGFRTPAFKRNRYTDEVLEDLGFVYDASTTKSKLRNRYVPMQYANSEKLIYISISTIRDRFPSGVKWMNMFGTKLTGGEPYIIYAHPFDFLTMKEVMKLYDKNKIPILVLAFYLDRVGSPYNTLRNICKGSDSIINLIEKGLIDRSD